MSQCINYFYKDYNLHMMNYCSFLQPGKGVRAEDIDYKDNGRILYKVTGVKRSSGTTSLTDLGRFTIDPDDGTLRLAGTLADIRRRKQLPQFKLEITATDRAVHMKDRM